MESAGMKMTDQIARLEKLQDLAKSRQILAESCFISAQVRVDQTVNPWARPMGAKIFIL